MKKISSISDQIKNNTYSYTGKGSFENIVKKHSSQVIQWLEELVPLQVQMGYLDNMENVNFQKRNYTRILTKLFTDEYKEFVSLNILIRDTSAIAKNYEQTYDMATLYKILIEKKYLKYPGKYNKYVEFDLFQKFIMTYKDDIIKSSQNNQNSTIPQPNPTPENKIENPTVQNNSENLSKEQTQIEQTKQKDDKKESNNKWTNLLLGKIK